MNTYSTPTILKETLNNGRKIPLIIYEMNPMRDPNKRINHYRNIFKNESALFNKTQTLFNKKKVKKASQRKRNIKSVKNKLYNSLYQNLFLRINYERPREIKNEDGVIISRHFKTLDINSKDFPKQKIRKYYFSNIIPSQKNHINIINNKNHFRGGNFFSTAIKYPLNIYNKSYNEDNKIKKYDSFTNSNSKNIFGKSINAINKGNYQIFNIENYDFKNINHRNFNINNKYDSQVIPPLLNYKNKNSNKRIKNDIFYTKKLLKLNNEEKKRDQYP